MILDAYALVKAKKMGPDELVRMLAAYKGEENTTVWKALHMVLLQLEKVGHESVARGLCLVTHAAKLSRIPFKAVDAQSL